MDGHQDTKATLRDMPAMTEKGFTHKRNALRTQIRRSVKIMQKQIELIRTLFESGDTESVGTENDTLRRLYQDITDANKQLASCFKSQAPSEEEEKEDLGDTK